MKTIHVLVYEDAVPSAVAASVDILTHSARMMQAAGKAPAFALELISAKYRNVMLNSPLQFMCQRNIDELPPDGDGERVIVIPAFAGEWDAVLEKNRALLPWLAAHYRAGTELASLCLGSYFLAEAGLLDGKICTSHWRAMDDMRRRYPAVRLQPDSVVTDQQGIYTGGGAFSSLNLLLYLVEKFCGHDIGILVSKNFSIHRDHVSQGHFSVFRGMNRHGDKLVLQAQDFIENNYGKELSVDDVAGLVNMSKRNFIRRFKQATQNTPLEYMQKVKIEVVKKALETGRESVQSLMYRVGYNDSKTFRDVFRRITGVTPQAYRKKYGLN